MAYRAEIEIGVKGVEALTKLQKRLEGTNFKIDEINKKQSTTFGGLAQSIQNYSRQLFLAEKALKKVAAATPQETRAVNNYVTALGNANAARERQNKLIEQEIANRTGATAALKAYNAAAAAPTQRGAATTMAGGYMRGAFRGGSQYPGPIGPGAASSTALFSPLPARSARTTQYLSPIGPVSPQERTGRAEQLAKEAALKSKANKKEFEAQKAFQTELFNIEKRFENSLNRQRKEADDAEFDRLLKRLEAEQSKLDEIDKKRAKLNKQIGEDFDKRSTQAGNLRGQTSPIGGAVGIPGSPAAKQRTARNKRLQSAASNAIIGGAFPLLFGQGIGASVGGAAGGGLGGLAGGQFGFGLSLVGTAVGAAVDGIIKNAEDLGKALNGLDGNFAAVLEATGDAENGFGALVNEIAEVIGKEKALEVATQRLAVIVGDEGVNALKEFGNDTSNLGNELTKAFTAVSASIADFINKLGVLDATANRINFVRLTQKEASTPEIKKLQEERDSFDKGIIFGGDPAKVRELNEQIAALQRIAEEEENISVIKAAQLELQQNVNRKTSSSIEIKQQEIIIAENGGDLLNEQVVAALENAAAEKVRLKILEAQGDPLKVNLALLEGQLDFVSRINRIEQARKRKEEQDARDAEAAARKAEREEARRQKEIERAAKEKLRLESGLLNINLQKTFESLKQIEIQKGSEASLSTELASIQSILQNRVEIVQKSGEDITLQKERIELLEAQAFTRKIEIEQQLKQIQNEKELIKLQNQRDLEGTRTGLEQELAGLSILESPDDALRREQSDRYANTLAAINNEIEEQNLLISQTPSPNQEIISAAQSRIEFLNKESNIYKELLPQIAQAEQAQLQFNQAFEAVSPAVNSLVGGLREVVAGTKSAEEAFADFLNTIADQLIQTAATLIAQYIAIGLAKAFAGLSGGSSGLDFNTSAPSITGNTLSDFGGGSPFAGAFRANGGPVTANEPYIVGERGIELMVPSTSGRVLSNSETRQQLGSQQSAASTREQLDRQQAVASTREQLNNQQAVASTREQLNNQQAKAMQPLDIRYESTVINNVEYVTAEQHRKGMAQAAERGRAMTLTTLQNSPRTRSRVGI